MLTRREFGAALLASAAPSEYRPQIAAQAYVWSQQFDREKRSHEEGAAEMLAAVKRAGYTQIELMPSFLTPRVRDLLATHGVKVPIVYAGGALHTPETAAQSMPRILEVAEKAKGFGARFINHNPDPKPRREAKTDGELAEQARNVDVLGARIRSLGMRLLLHHHDPEMRDNAREWRHLLERTDPKLSGLCIDIDWMWQGGQQPLPLLREAAQRVESLHLRNAAAGLWTESLGEGDYDYAPVAQHLRSIGYRGYLVVELAHRPNTRITRSLEENLRLSRESVERVFGVRS